MSKEAGKPSGVVTSRNAGPHGFGDPNDTSLRQVELNVKIAQKVREKSRTIKCKELAKEFSDCAKKYGLGLPFMCRKESDVLKECLAKWYQDKDLQEECKQEYLAERAEFRRTGIPPKKYSVRL